MTNGPEGSSLLPFQTKATSKERVAPAVHKQRVSQPASRDREAAETIDDIVVARQHRRGPLGGGMEQGERQDELVGAEGPDDADRQKDGPADVQARHRRVRVDEEARR